LSKWGVLAAALAAVVAFVDNLSKVFGTLTQLPLPDWAVVLSQYKMELAAAIMLAAVAFTLNWSTVTTRYGLYRKLWISRRLQIRFISVYPEELALLVCFAIFGVAFFAFEIEKARNLYTSYGFGYIVNTRCDGDFLAAHDRSEALAKNRLWNKYSDVLNNLKDRYEYLSAIGPRRVSVFGRYKDELPTEILQGDSYELRVLFGINIDAGARAREPKGGLSKSWLQSPAPCKSF